MKEETPGCYDCQICGKQFKRKNNLKLHQICHKPEAKKIRYQCISCNEVFPKMMDKKEHELKCERNESLSGLECCFCDLPCDTPKEVHIQRNHRSHVKPELSINEETLSKKEENASNTLTDVNDLFNQLQFWKDLSENLEKKPSSMQVPQVDGECIMTVNYDKDKPFTCLHCGSHYKHKNSMITHELKYHGKSELTRSEDSQHFSKENNSQENKTNEVSNKDESVSKFERKEGETPENGVNNDNNIIHKIKEEIDCSRSLADNGLPVPDKKFSRRFYRFRKPTIKKKCIGCDKAFDIPRERDEHELECDINSFNRKLNCIFCDHPFSKPKALRKHENKHRPLKKTKRYKHRCFCIKCNKTFDAIYTLRVHLQRVHRRGHVVSYENKPFTCSICKARFKYEISKRKHEMRCHGADMDHGMEHGIGDKVFTNFIINDQTDLDGLPVTCALESGDIQRGEDHVIKEEPCGEGSLGYPTENTVINSVFNIKTEVDAEMGAPLNSPSGIKADGVDDADKASSPPRQRKRKGKQPVVRKQKRKKTGPFVCNNCEAKFSSPQGLWLHSYHQNMRTKRLSCIGCAKKFKNEKDKEEHELKCNLNHNEYDFNCMFCDETYGNPKLLRNHELKHRPLRRTKNHKCICIDCRKPFKFIHSLKEHIRECHKNHVKAEEVCTQTDERKPVTMEDMKSCYVLLKDIGQVRTKKGKGIWKSCRIRRKRTKTDRVVGDAECRLGSDASENDEHAAVVGVKEEFIPGIYYVSGGDEYTVEDTKREVDDFIEAPTYLVETELANPEELMEDGEAGSLQWRKCNLKFDSHGKHRYHSYNHRQRTKRLFCIGCAGGFKQSNNRDSHELECDVNLTN